MHRVHPHTHEPQTLERVRTLAFQGRYAEAETLLANTPCLSPALEAWRGTINLFLGHHELARQCLTNALLRDHGGARAGLASLQRLRGEARDHLRELRDADLEPLDDFDRANLEREIGLLHEERDELVLARDWLERAWRTAQIGVDGRHQIASIAHGLGRVYGRLGFDALGVAALDEGLRHTRHDRRVPLLYERVQRKLVLLDLDSAHQDLEEINTRVGDSADLQLLTQYVTARLHHARGDEALARQHFSLVAAFAEGLETPVARDVAFHAVLHLARLETDAERLDVVPAHLERAERLAGNERHRAWVELRRARWVAMLGEHGDASDTLAEVVRRFEAIHCRVEANIARLHRAESLLRHSTDGIEEADAELLEVAEFAEVIGSAAPFTWELQVLTAVRVHLTRARGFALTQRLLETTPPVRRARLREHTLEVNGARVPLEDTSRRLLAYLVRHPASTWGHVRFAVFAELEETEALQMFEKARGELEIVGFEVVYHARRNAYSVVWNTVSLER